MRALLLAMICLAFSSVADAQDEPDTPPAAAPGGLRGPQTDASNTDAARSGAPAATSASAAPFSRLPSEANLDANSPLGDSAVGKCRQGCAKTYYFCLAADGAAGCSDDWTTCLVACSRAPPPDPLADP